MRKITYLKTLFVAISLVIGSVYAFGQETVIYSTGFEVAQGYTASTTYNNATPVICGPGAQSWSVIMGTASATGFITGAQSLQMRSYANNTTLGSMTMNFDLTQVTKVTFNAKANDANTSSFNAYYSTDYGATWSTATSISVSTTMALKTLVISSTGEYKAVRIKIENSVNNIAGRLTIDDVNIYGMTPTVPLTATPAISIATGKYFTQQNVMITSSTPGASIFYTTDGTIPSDASSLYAAPIVVNSTQTINAIAYATGNEPSLLSMTTYTFPTNVSKISDLRIADVNGFYKLTSEAILTYQASATYGKPKFVQDASAGIMIYDSNSKITTSYNQYEGITGLIGTLSLYNGLLEFIPITDPGAATSMGNSVTPIIATLATLANYPSQLVTINNVSITGSGNFIVSTAYVINDGTAGKLRTAYVATDLPYIGSEIPQVKQNITGISYNFSSTETDLLPRTGNDFVPATLTSINQAKFISNIYVLKSNIIFTATGNETVEIYNAVGQKLLQKLAIEGVNKIFVSDHGVVLVKVGNHSAKVIL